MLSELIASLFVAAAVAAPAPLEKRGSPSVTISNGTVVGTSSGGVDSFKGIPFAQPPVGNLRLKPPLPLSTSFGTFTSKTIPPACPQFYFDTSSIATTVLGDILDLPLLQTVQQESEDCLTIDIQRPSTATASSKLPVLFWIFGGGFELGSTQLYDGANIVQKSIALGEPIIWVAVNYRVGGFGFLAGKEIKADGSSNLGLKDQRLGLQWVQDNIAAFGGDPTKVTIWGESAGAISVYDHTIINGGDNTYHGNPLFRGAIMNSGSVIPTQDVDSATAQAIYDQVVAKAGCSSAADTLTCLRGVDYSTMLAAANSVPGILGYRSVDLSYLPRPDPSDNFFPLSPELAIGNAAKVPVIIGDQEDEGTLFALFQSNISNTAELVDYLASYFPETTKSVVQGLVDLYPDDPTQGSPYNTGILYELYPEYKRLASILGDATFTLTRRAYLAAISSEVKAWSYLSSYFDTLPFLGTGHGTDILPLFFNFGIPSVPANTILTYYISFVNNLDPNAIANLITWPQYTTSTKQLVNFNLLSNSLITDDFRQDAYNYLLSHVTDFRVKK